MNKKTKTVQKCEFCFTKPGPESDESVLLDITYQDCDTVGAIQKYQVTGITHIKKPDTAVRIVLTINGLKADSHKDQPWKEMIVEFFDDEKQAKKWVLEHCDELKKLLYL